eukprot:gb/GECH01014283.1/.p1 GENE.gb/GECH01014283.1/~~gb/GECH01014283.1/.p1  ORF type:complete len:716 (+),score=224.47 gb/GECH01014283.1/:1-2148(+)
MNSKDQEFDIVWNNLQDLHEFWKDVNLSKIREKLDEQGLKVAKHQEQSSTNRKKLADTTKKFRKKSDEEKLKTIGNLLRSYQEEIDNLTQRAKFSESAFLDVYSWLSDAPDPSTNVGRLIDMKDRILMGASLETENRQLKDKIEEYESEFSELKNQDVTIRRLEEENRNLKQKIEEELKQMMESKESEFESIKETLSERYKLKEQQLEEQLESLKEENAAQQEEISHKDTQIMRLRSRENEVRAGESAQRDLENQEIDLLNGRIATLEAENHNLRDKIKKLENSDEEDQDDKYQFDDWVAERSHKEAQIKLLNEQCSELKRQIEEAGERHSSDVDEFQDTIKQLNKQINSLKTELNSRPTQREYESITSRLAKLENIEYGVDTEECGLSSTEELLSKKNRSLQSEITHLQVELSAMRQNRDDAREEVDHLRHAVEEKSELITKLEKDIESQTQNMEQLQNLSTPFSSSSVIQSSSPNSSERTSSGQAPQPPTSQGGDLRGDGASGSSSGVPPSSMSPRSPISPDNHAEASTMLKIISGQRDRFRKALLEQQQETERLQHENEQYAAAMETLRNDNVKLYEKIRYLQSYAAGDSHIVSTSNNATGSFRRRSEGGDVTVDMNGVQHDDPQEKYHKLYEDSINPFTQFSRRERDRRYKQLGLVDKVSLETGKLFLQHRYARMFIFLYSCLLHFVVFMACYKLANLSVDSSNDMGTTVH